MFSPQAVLGAIMKPDASKQHKPGGVAWSSAYYGDDGPFCWNCELTFKSLEDAPPDLPMHFCDPICRQEWTTRQPLQNLLDKRRMRRERGKP
jgi:hypothetical protein